MIKFQALEHIRNFFFLSEKASKQLVRTYVFCPIHRPDMARHQKGFGQQLSLVSKRCAHKFATNAQKTNRGHLAKNARYSLDKYTWKKCTKNERARQSSFETSKSTITGSI